jgi:hypothetical protein
MPMSLARHGGWLATYIQTLSLVTEVDHQTRSLMLGAVFFLGGAFTQAL